MNDYEKKADLADHRKLERRFYSQALYVDTVLLFLLVPVLDLIKRSLWFAAPVAAHLLLSLLIVVGTWIAGLVEREDA